MTTPNPSDSPDPVEIAFRIIELNADVYRKLDTAQYEDAARLRDQREQLENQLEACGNALLIRNVKAATEGVFGTWAQKLIGLPGVRVTR